MTTPTHRLSAAAGSLLAILTLAAGCSTPTESRPPAPMDGGTGAPVPPPPPPSPNQDPTYRFGAKFEPPVGRVVHGEGQWKAYNDKYEALLPADRQPAAELRFVDLGDTPRGWEPDKIAASLAAIDGAGRIPSIDISLRGLKPTPAELATLPDPLFGIDHDVANSTTYDARILDLIQMAKAFRKPIMLRIGGEFNGWWNGYHPYEYPKAFRKIVSMFRQAGATNVAFVWCYEPAAPDDFDAVNAAGEPKWYPGADVVDWFSIDLFAAQDVGGPVVGHNGAGTSHGRTLRFLDMAVAQNKPVVIAESSPSHYNLGNPASAEAAWAEWFTPYWGLIASRPEILWFHYINYDWTLASDYLANGWQNNDLGASPSIASRYVAELGAPKYLHAGERHLLKDYQLYQ